jgi:hypothetical protein
MRSVKGLFFMQSWGIWMLAGAVSAWASADEIPCAQEVQARELAPLHFVVDPEWQHLQRSNFPELDRNGWVEGEWIHGQLRFNHLAPGVGLAFEFLFVKIEVLDETGQVIRELSTDLPSSNECFLLSIFPGGSTKWFDVSKNLQSLKTRARVRVRVFVPQFN